MERHTPLYDAHVAAGAKMAPFAGYVMPIRYAGDTAEHQLVRTGVGLFDVSHMGEFLFRGPKALPLLQKLTTNDVSKIPVGKAQYNCLPNERGGIVDDLIIYRLEDDLYLMVVNAANLDKDWNWITAHNDLGADVQNLSDDTALIAVSGPRAPETLARLTDIPVHEMGYYQARKGRVLDYDNVLVATTGYTGEKTFEIFLRNEQARPVWDALLAAGAEFGAQPTGLAARDTLRLEMGYMLYGNDITDDTSPLEAGLGWITKLDKGAFSSSEIFGRQKAEGVARKLIGFEMIEPRAIPRSHYPIAHNGRIVGEVTSGTFSPTLQKGIGMGYVEAALADADLDVIIREKPARLRVARPPFVPQTSVREWFLKKV